MSQAIQTEQAARAIVATLRSAGHQAYYAGGCVRDRLLGRPAKDYDVATSATPDAVLALFPRTFAVGAHFGVVLVVTEHAAVEPTLTEVATFRHDGTYSDGRRPDAVRYSLDPREDVARRDFTINGMLFDPFAAEGQDAVLDFVGGRDDLAAGLVRAIGEPGRRFAEDKLRMLRAVRFAARLRFALEPSTEAAIRAEAHTLHRVSPERIRDELTRMLTEGQASYAFELLDRTGLLREVLPEVDRMHGVDQPPDWHPEGDVWVHTLLLLAKLKADVAPTLAWAALLHDVGKPPCAVRDPEEQGGRIRFNGHAEVGTRMTEAICARLRFSHEDTAQIALLVANHMRFGDVEKMKQSTLKRFLRLPRFDEHLALHRMDCLSSHGILRLYDYAKHHYESTPDEAVRPPLLVTGADLIAAGYRPGPIFKELLTLAEDAQLEGRIHTRDEGLTLVKAYQAGSQA